MDATLAPSLPGRRRARGVGWPRWRFSRSSLLYALVLALIGLLTLYPIGLLFGATFEVGVYGQQTHFGFENWISAVTEPALRTAIWNTFTLTFTRQAIALVVGISIAWCLARTDLPGRNWLEFGFWIAAFLPTLTVLLGWILLFDGNRGIVNQLARAIGFSDPPFEIFSWWGIVWVHLVTGTLPVKVILLTPAFRNMDASLEEASRASGGGMLTTFIRVLIPIMLPTILVVLLLGVIRSMEAFEIELILGAPEHLEVYSTLIYRQVFQQPPEYGTSAVLALLVLGSLVPFIALQQWLGQRHSVATLTGRYAGRPHRLRRWRWPLFGLLLSMVIVMTALPVSLVLMSTFMRLFGFFTADPWTLNHWTTTLAHPNLQSGLRNSLILGVSAALLAVFAYSLVAYISVKSRFFGRSALDFLTWLPTAVPGIVISLAFLWMFLQVPVFRPLYNTMPVLIIAVLLGGLTAGVQVTKGGLMQIGRELEEASHVCGASFFYTFTRVVLPLIMPALAAVAMLTFAGAVRSVGLIALLSTRSIAPLSIIQLDFLADGSFERASVVGVLVFFLSVGAALIARTVGLRFGAGRI